MCAFKRLNAFPSLSAPAALSFQDGFLTLVIPMIRFNGGVPVLVHSRRSPPDESLPKGNGTPGANENSRETELWDLRVKVDLTGQSAPASSPISGDAAKEGGALLSREG